MFFDYASYTSALAWMATFGYSQIKSTIKKLRARNNGADGESINFQYTDQLNVLMRAYKEVPIWWYIALFLCSFIAITSMVASGNLYIPFWTYLIALLTGAVMVTPLGWLYALSNYQLPIGTTNELLYGVMINAVNGHKNPTGATIYSSVAGDAWYRAQLMLQDQKIGHYMHIPPRATFFSQVFGATIGIPINYAVIRWVVSTKTDYLTGAMSDPTHQWTGQLLSTSLSTSVQYVLVVSYNVTGRIIISTDQIEPGPQEAVPRTTIQGRPLWFPRRPWRPNRTLHPSQKLPQVETEIPSLEHDHFLLLPFRLLRKYQLRIPLSIHWQFCGYVLGFPIQIQAVGEVQLHLGCCV
jgi:hypothetical protein